MHFFHPNKKHKFVGKNTHYRPKNYLTMGYTNKVWAEMSDSEILRQIGTAIKSMRLSQNKTQAQLAESAGLNRWTISQIEKGESVSLTSLIPILRALDSLQILDNFTSDEEISPLEYAKLKKQKRKRVRPYPSGSNSLNEEIPEW
jgi:transcriptional regulator with XRE-family HTH domain